MKPQAKLNPEIEYTFNIVNLIRLRDHLVWMKDSASCPAVGFNMGEYLFESDEMQLDHSGHNCGTVACLAGHAVILNTGTHNTDEYFDDAKTWLGLSQAQASYLFFGHFTDPSSILSITLDQAIAELDYMISNGRTSEAI